MKKTLFLLSFLLIFLVSCGNSGNGNNGEEKVSDADGNGETTPAEEEPDEDETPENTAKHCVVACETAADCVISASNAIMDADNYRCVDRKCEYAGCNSDAECDEVYAAQDTKYYCNKNGAYGYAECTPACNAATDCAAGTSTDSAFDADNYKCENNRCVYAGCNNDAECQYGGIENMRCVPEKSGEKTLNICVQSCASPADCANPTYPEEFYECRNSQCVTKSCESDEWCKEYMTDDYVCR